MNTISTFWRAHPSYWIAIGDIQSIADKEIYETFENVNLSDYYWIDQVIYLDQFMRHFQRANPHKYTEEMVCLARVRATQIVTSNIAALHDLDEFQLVFCLMPFKHVGDFEFIFTSIHEKWVDKDRLLRNYPLIWRFYSDSYTKYYSKMEVIAAGITEPLSEAVMYDPDLICDSYPLKYNEDDWSKQPIPDVALPLIKELRKHSCPLIVSLSGGVDSMVMCYLMKRAMIPFVAVHIIYGNRDVSESEYTFICDYCKRLGIQLYSYRIEWLRRAYAEREYYEEMTRRIRFTVYRCVGNLVGAETHVVLGHILDDLVENIWTNFAHATHLTNLMKMSPHEIMEGVHIHRPWLEVKKSTVYTISDALGIPYLKNTTPSWSNRGKFREKFYAATHDQFGPSVDDKILESARALAAQSDLVERLLYKPVYESWNSETRMLDITRAIEAGLDGDGWSRIFTTICHTKLGISKPSIHACRDFCTRVGRGLIESHRVPMKKDLTVVYHPDGERKVLQFVVE